MNELLENLFAPRAEGATAETTTEAFHAGKADAVKLMRIAVEHRHAGIGHDLHHFVLLAGFEVVISQDSDCGDSQRGGDVLRQDFRLFNRSVVGEITTE